MREVSPGGHVLTPGEYLVLGLLALRVTALVLGVTYTDTHLEFTVAPTIASGSAN